MHSRLSFKVFSAFQLMIFSILYLHLVSVFSDADNLLNTSLIVLLARMLTRITRFNFYRIRIHYYVIRQGILSNILSRITLQNYLQTAITYFDIDVLMNSIIFSPLFQVLQRKICFRTLCEWF